MPTDSAEDDEGPELDPLLELAWRRRNEEPPPPMSECDFLAWRSPRRGESNPTRLDNPLWNWLVRTCWNAYHANKFYSGPSPFDHGSKWTPTWTFDRFGMSTTSLADGRVIHIGGEHEDWYDPDFYIYNDVTVIDVDESIAIYAYPIETFPPTDFHTATLVGNDIYIIGRLGYAESRVANTTPVYRLSLDSMSIEPLSTSGEPPGWIYRHSATLTDDGQSIVVSGGVREFGASFSERENIDSWALHTRSGEWRRLTAHNWQHWIMRRVDRERNRLWDIRQAQWHRDQAILGLKHEWPHAEPPDFEALDTLYRAKSDSAPPKEGADYRRFEVDVDGLLVRFREDSHFVEAIVEGELNPTRLSEFQRTTLSLLERIDCSTYEIEGGGGTDAHN